MDAIANREQSAYVPYPFDALDYIDPPRCDAYGKRFRCAGCGMYPLRESAQPKVGMRIADNKIGVWCAVCWEEPEIANS